DASLHKPSPWAKDLNLFEENWFKPSAPYQGLFITKKIEIVAIKMFRAMKSLVDWSMSHSTNKFVNAVKWGVIVVTVLTGLTAILVGSAVGTTLLAVVAIKVIILIATHPLWQTLAVVGGTLLTGGLGYFINKKFRFLSNSCSLYKVSDVLRHDYDSTV